MGVDSFLSDLKDHQPNIPIVLCGNKTDLIETEGREVSLREAATFAQENGK